MKAAGIDDLHFHDLRRTFSTRARRFTDPFTIKALLGHSQIQTTEGYVAPQMAEMREAVESLAAKPARVIEFGQVKTG